MSLKPRVEFTRPKHERLVGGGTFAACASLIRADANKQYAAPRAEWDLNRIDVNAAPRAVREYLDVLDDAAFGAASEVEPKFTSFADPASQWTGATKGSAFFAYSDNHLIDTDHGVIVDGLLRLHAQGTVHPKPAHPKDLPPRP